MNLAERLVQDGYEANISPVLFFGQKENKKYFPFSNFSPHGIWLPNPLDGKLTYYRTGEHRYQAMKAMTMGEHEYVRLADNAFIAKERGREVDLRFDWGSHYGDFCWYVMLETIVTKATAHKICRDLLKETGERPIYEDSPTDDIWGVRYRNDYRGQNLLGRCWMAVRNLLHPLD